MKLLHYKPKLLNSVAYFNQHKVSNCPTTLKHNPLPRHPETPHSQQILVMEF